MLPSWKIWIFRTWNFSRVWFLKFISGYRSKGRLCAEFWTHFWLIWESSIFLLLSSETFSSVFSSFQVRMFVIICAVSQLFFSDVAVKFLFQCAQKFAQILDKNELLPGFFSSFVVRILVSMFAEFLSDSWWIRC